MNRPLTHRQLNQREIAWLREYVEPVRNRVMLQRMEPPPSNREIGVGIFCAVSSVLFLFALSEMFR